MSLETLLTRTATLRRFGAGSHDAHGNPARVLTAELVVNVYLEQQQPRELLIGRETYLATHRAVLPAGVAIDGSDELVVDGKTYQVVGPVSSGHRPSSGEHHLEVLLLELNASAEAATSGGWGGAWGAIGWGG